MKNTRKVLAAVLALVMVLGCMASFTFASAAAETEVNLAPDFAESMIMITRGDKANGLALFTDGSIDDTDAGYYTLGGGSGYWCDDDGNALPIDENPAVVEVTMTKAVEITAINVGFLTPGDCYSGDRYYHWEAYASNDNTLPISEWTKVGEKKTNEIADTDGHKVTLTNPGTYQYIRIYGVYNSAIENDGWRGGFIHVNEVEIWGPELSDKPAVLYPEKWTAPANGTNLIAGNETCVVKADRGNLPEMTDGYCGDKASDNYWTAGSGGASVPMENPIENECGAWFQVNLDEVCEIDAIRIVTLLNDKAVYHWEIYATDDAEMALEGWDFIGEKKTDEISNADGYAIFFDEPIEAQYIRIYGTKGYEDRFRVTEIEIWDIEEGGATPEPSPEAVQLEGATYGSGMENWENSKNKPEGHPAVFEILFGAKYAGDFNKAVAEMAFANKDYLDWTLYISKNQDMTDAVEVNLAPASAFYMTAYACFRFETALADEPWVPEVGVTYYINGTVKGDGVDFFITGPATGFVMNTEPITKDYKAPSEEPTLVDIEINPYESGDIKGFENWANQTQLLIRVDGGNTVNYGKNTWKITLVGGGVNKTITMVPSSDNAPWLYRFETCLLEGDAQFIPVVGTDYTISVEIYNEAGEMIAKSQERAGFIPFQDPIVPEVEEPDVPVDPDTPVEPDVPVEPDTPVEPDEPDVPPQTGDAAVYATIAVAVAAVALAVVFRKRRTI